MPSIRECRFLLGYKPQEGDQPTSGIGKLTYELLNADEIFILDNDFLARLFPAAGAPREKALEELYQKVGSRNISVAVERHLVTSDEGLSNQTKLANDLKDRISARAPLLLAPSIMTRQSLLSGAESVLTGEQLQVYEASGSELMVEYSFKGTVHRRPVTCGSRQTVVDAQASSIFVVQGYKWLDVGSTWITATTLFGCRIFSTVPSFLRCYWWHDLGPLPGV